LILLVDNYDSFVWNLDHALRLASRALGSESDVLVVRNDAIDAQRARDLAPEAIVLSPGPCGPDDAGACTDLVRTLGGVIPILGVCLGHQAIGAASGMPVVRASEPVHGKRREITHDGRTIFRGLPSPMRVARYHSLVLREEHVREAIDPDGAWEVSARTDDGVVIALRRVWSDPSRAPVEGVQFHPESYMTDHGVALLANFLRMTDASRRLTRPDTIASP
jgi:anthranilate synthase/aminodeoxychorismate synthase-like glutamine amidotransferase